MKLQPQPHMPYKKELPMRMGTIALFMIGASLFTVCCRPATETEDAAAIARRWVELYNDGTPTYYGSDRFLELYAEDCVWTESPSKMYPQGRKGSLAQLRPALAAGQAVLVNRHVVLKQVVGSGPIGAMHYIFSATVNKDVPGYSKGDRISLEVAAFLKVRQGLIIEIHELIVELT
jgi:ketosteroid isomerase-like protein